MSDYNTGNPVPSIDPRDLDDNAKILDRLLLESVASVLDRLGVPRKTWWQIEQDAAALVSPNVSALAGLTGAVNKAIVFTGSGAMELITLSPLSRTLLDDTTEAAMLATLTAAKNGVNNDITELSALLTAITVAQGGTGASTASGARANLGVRNTSTRYIDGFNMVWGASSISVSPGAAYIGSLGRAVESSAVIVVPLSGLTGGTFYHLYLYESAGVAAIELSATAPVSVATGGFSKTGDASRRYLSSVLASGATSVYQFIQNGSDIDYLASPVAGTPFEVLAGGTATTATNVSAAAMAPVTAIKITAMVRNPSGASNLYLANSDVGTVSATVYLRVLFVGHLYVTELPLNASLQFSYLFDSAPSAGAVVRATGYTFRR